ncbi:MFS transporter [Massilia terrae]|uniref:MFS transporter n=1 Tax=Massilia terrae TaxID=1811224 RepID=A0ABT2CS60_9BURK|nr:MFS transporter [Massilia terrae]MCS0656819.1 MFS transporter [Massilia terrae]
MHATLASRGPDGGRGRATLMLCHFVGMVDLVALPVWVGTLVQHYGFDLEYAGMIVTAFLLGAVAASLFAAPLYNRLPRRACAAGGYGVAALAFLAASQAHGLGALLALHLVAGLATGAGLSVVHGTIGRSANPHRLFALAGTALGIGAVGFYAAVPPAVAALGGAVLFKAFAGLMALAALACAFGFPQVAGDGGQRAAAGRLPRAAWFAILGVSCMALNQALTFSMLDRIGALRGFGQERVNIVLIVCGLVNLLPAAIAALLQRRLNPVRVALVAAPLQVALALTVTLSGDFFPYALAGSVYPAVLIFTHTFLFGLIASLDPSGRALASTPAMMMTGSAIGPALAGSVAMRAGFAGQAVLAVAVGCAALLFFALVARRAARPLAVGPNV